MIYINLLTTPNEIFSFSDKIIIRNLALKNMQNVQNIKSVNVISRRSDIDSIEKGSVFSSNFLLELGINVQYPEKNIDFPSLDYQGETEFGELFNVAYISDVAKLKKILLIGWVNSNDFFFQELFDSIVFNRKSLNQTREKLVKKNGLKENTTSESEFDIYQLILNYFKNYASEIFPQKKLADISLENPENLIIEVKNLELKIKKETLFQQKGIYDPATYNLTHKIQFKEKAKNQFLKIGIL